MMTNQKTVLTAFLCTAALITGCQKAPQVKDPVAKIGNETVGMESFEAFKMAARAYPAMTDIYPNYFPGGRQPITFLVETEAVYQATKSSGISEKILGSRDWEWKKTFYTAALYRDLLIDNLGFTNAELEDYYNKNTDAWRVNTRTDDGENDSSYVQEFSFVKRQIADNLFYERHKPDSAFLARVSGPDAEYDSAAVRSHWLYNARSNPEDFFMRIFFKEQTGETYTDSIQQIYGEGKPIVPEDLEIIRSWVVESRRNSMLTKDLVEYLYKWKVFAVRAEKMGLASGQEFNDMMRWAARIEHVVTYLQNEVLPKASASVKPAGYDTCLARLQVYDQWGRVNLQMGEQRLASEIENINKLRVGAIIDSAIHGMRKNKVTFLQNDFKDERGASPAALLAKADSLRDLAADDEAPGDENIIEEAEAAYRILTSDFAFSPEGRKAFGEIAKIQIDKYNSNARGEKFLLSSAISYYRRGQMLETDPETICNSSFMIGFTYDEHLNNYPLAEANYKWILRHTPSCALAADAEFMLQHLDEPMTSIEEIQGQSKRQGRQVEFDDDAVEEEGGSGEGVTL